MCPEQVCAKKYVGTNKNGARMTEKQKAHRKITAGFERRSPKPGAPHCVSR